MYFFINLIANSLKSKLRYRFDIGYNLFVSIANKQNSNLDKNFGLAIQN